MLYKQLTLALILIGIFAAGIETALPAEFKLASRFQDGDGDMVADTRSDPGKQMDPSTLIFAYTPVEDPAVYTKVWKGFLEYMEKVTGKGEGLQGLHAGRSPAPSEEREPAAVPAF
jgi:phosphonate transport system substrate-binding protein